MASKMVLEVSASNIPSDHSVASAMAIDSSTDLLREILLSLPVKSLLVFKSVSKRWLSLISDPHFVRNHCHKKPTHDAIGLFFEKFSFITPKFEFISLDQSIMSNTGAPFKSLNFFNDSAGIKIEQSCNGLLSCCSFRAGNTKRDYYIYNPSTTAYVKLPKSPSRKGSPDVPVCSVSLAFDPRISPYYKAVCILNTDVDTYRIEVYSSETSSWKICGYVNSTCDGLFSKSGVFWNGSLHWISLEESSDHYVLPGHRMSLREYSMVYDVDQEVMSNFAIPPIYKRPTPGKRRIGYFGECRGHMRLIEISSLKSTQFDVLEMGNDHMWNVKYRVNLDVVLKSRHGTTDVLDPHLFSVLLVREDESEEYPSLLLRVSNNIVSYNLKTKVVENIAELPRCSDSKGRVRNIWLDVYQYIDTLAWI